MGFPFMLSKKRLLFLLFFSNLPLFAQTTSQTLTNLALEKHLDKSHVWHSLLHYKKSSPSINNPSFLLTYGNFTVANELNATIEGFFSNPNLICKYPARYLWLQTSLDPEQKLFPKVSCKDFDDYIQKTSPKELKLIFVSEDVTNPSSMMGHTFFNLIGEDNNGKKRENAVSFSTVIDTFNLPLLIVKSTMTGMKGLFVLSPYKEQVGRYLYDEERNIWEYDLKLKEEEKKLIYYHFWELKDINMKYLFTGFNCATVIDDMLAISDPDYMNDNELWVTPKDVIKKAQKYKLVENMKLIPSKRWEIKMYIDTLGENEADNIKKAIQSKDINLLKDYSLSKNIEKKILQLGLMESYTDFLLNSANEISNNEAQMRHSIIKSKREVGDEIYNIDLSKYKNPINSFNDSQLSLGHINSGGKDKFQMRFLPASNLLYDDNREYFGETSLKIGEMTLLGEDKNIKIDNFTLFNMKSLLPQDTLTGGISSEIKIAYENHYDKNLKPFHAYNISAGIGITKKITDDIIYYSLLEGGSAYGNNELYFYAYPEVGFMIYELFDMKTNFEYRYIFNKLEKENSYHDIHIEQSLFFDKKYRLGIGLERKINQNTTIDGYSFSLNYFF